MKTCLLAILTLAWGVCSAQFFQDDLYVGEAVVLTKDAGERNQALPQALKQVLQKFSGLREFDEVENFEQALNRAASLVVSVHYRTVDRLQADGSTFEETLLVARFSMPDVDALRQELQLPFWQPDRETVTIWVVVDSGLSRQIMPVEYTYVREAMSAAAYSRGLPVNWPEPDESGEYPVDLSLLWGGYIEDIAGPGGKSVLLAAARREGAQWNVRLNLAVGENLWNWRSQGLELGQVLEESVHQAANEIAAANSITATDQGTWLHDISVRGVTGEQDYIRTLNYLQELSVVERVDVNQARPGRISFVLQLNALPTYFEQAVESDGILEIDDVAGHYTLAR
jgi:hypothetical protein